VHVSTPTGRRTKAKPHCVTPLEVYTGFSQASLAFTSSGGQSRLHPISQSVQRSQSTHQGFLE